MFKRANKVTALLVAAASVMSVVPAMAADTTRLGNKEGTVKQGVAYGDGTYAYYGYKSDSDDTGVYIAKTGEDKPKLNDDLEDYRLDNDSKYGTKYVYAKEQSNDDEYLVDLSSGKIDEDETAEDKANDAKGKLVTNLKKADRYQSILDKSSDLESIFDNTTGTVGTFDQILKGQFGEIFYQYTITSTSATEYSYKDPVTSVTTTAQTAYTGFTDESGKKYIDLSQDTNLRVFSTKTGRAEYIKEYGEVDKDAQLLVNLVDVKPLAQDKDYIYTLTEVQVIDFYANDATNGVTSKAPETQYFVQKISKAQGSKDDNEAYTAKSIDSYQLQAPGTIYDEGDFDDAYNALTGNGDQADELLLGITVQDNSLYVARMEMESNGVDSKKFHLYKLDLGKYKKDTLVGKNIGKDVDTYAVAKDDDTDDGDIIDFSVDVADIDEGLQNMEPVLDRNNGANIEIAGQNIYRLPSISFATDGAVWGLEKGKVVKWDKLDKKEVYTVDRAMDALDVYDDSNLIVWDTEGDVYTNVSEGHKQTVDEGVAVDPTLGQTTPATVGWKQEATGWTFYDVSGTKVANYWVNDNGTWYYIKADGIMATGWAQVNGTWYYLKANGAMATGWLNDNGTWYYLASSGAMLANTTVDGYKLGASGAWIQ